MAEHDTGAVPSGPDAFIIQESVGLDAEANATPETQTPELWKSAEVAGATVARRRGRGLRLARAGTHGLLGILGAGIAGASVVAATLIPLPHFGVDAQSRVVSPEAALQQRICAGPILQFGDNLGLDATTAISVGQTDVTFASTKGTPELHNMDATENAENTPSQRLILPPPPIGEEPGILAGSQSQTLLGAELTGLAVSECAVPTTESWLVGGATTTGRTTLISLNNPSNVSATVTLTIYSEDGPVTAAGTEGIVVPPGGREVLSLAGFAPSIASPVVKVESVGGQITASLQQSIVRVLTPGGVDVVGASAAPAMMTVIPGIVISGQENIAVASALGGYDDLAGVLRVFVPGEGPAEIMVSALPEDGSSPGGSSTFTVQGSVVTDLSLADFTDGTWTLTVSSDRPAVAGARTSTVALADDTQSQSDSGPDAAPVHSVLGTDFAWFASAPPVGAQSLVSVAAGPSPMLHLVNTSGNTAAISIEPSVGEAKTVTVPAGHALAVSVTESSSYRLHGFNTLRVSVSYQGDGALAGFVVHPPNRASQPVRVFNQYG